MIHTSCRSESSFVRLGRLDKSLLCPSPTPLIKTRLIHFKDPTTIGDRNHLFCSLQLSGKLSGSARTLDPTNKNYAPELSTFGIIIEVNRSEVQWTSLSLEKLPSWSQLISAPGKYELLVRDFRLWALCINCGGSRFGKSRNTSLVFSRPRLEIS